MKKTKILALYTIASISFLSDPHSAQAQFITPFSATPMPSTMLQGNTPMPSAEGYGVYQPHPNNSMSGQNSLQGQSDANAAAEQARLEKIQNSEMGTEGSEETCNRASDEPSPAMDMTYGGQKKEKDPCAPKTTETSRKSKASSPQTQGEKGLKVGSQFSGKASVVSGDTLRINGTAIHLAGIEAPPPTEVCRSGSTAWHCGNDAMEQLQDVVAGRHVTCIIQAEKSDISGKNMPDATCTGASGISDLSIFQAKSGNAIGTAPETRSAMLSAKSQRVGIWLSQ